MFASSPALNRANGFIGLDPYAFAPPGGPMNGNSSANLAAPQQAAPPPSPQGIAAVASPNPRAAGGQPGMFAAQPKHKINLGDILGVLAAGGLGMEAGRGVPGAAEQLQNFQQMQMYRRKQSDAAAQTASYVQDLVARGMDPHDAAIIAADPSEMAKHYGTRFDAATIDEGSTRAIPNFDGTLNTYTAPKTFQNKADVVQMPGQQGVTAPFGMFSGGDAPQALGAPMPVPGLRSDAEQYASATGALPGTPDYTSAIKDFELKANGPTAFGNASQLQGARLSTQRDIAYHRDATTAANSIRSTSASTANTHYRVDHPASRAGPAAHLPTPGNVVGSIMAKQAAGQPLSPAEQGTLKDYRTHYKPMHGSPQISPNEPVAVGPNGQKLVIRGGKWVPAQ